MRMTDLQYAGIAINLSTLGQVDLSDNDPELLRNLTFLLEAAIDNIAAALKAQRAAADVDQLTFDNPSDDPRSGWLNMSNGEEIP